MHNKNQPYPIPMKTLLHLIIYLILFSCTTTVIEEESSYLPPKENGDLTQEQNLLINGNCEDWNSFISPNGALIHWFNPGNKNIGKDNNTIYEGRYSARLSAYKGETAILNQRVEVIPGHRLRICHHYYIEKGKKNGARMYCYFRTTPTNNIPNNELNEIYDKQTLQIIRGGGYGLSYFPLETGQWKTFDYIITIPPTARYFVFEIHSYYETTIYIDDCYVIDLKGKNKHD